MTFSEKIYKKTYGKNILEIGEVKISQAYLYGGDFEIVINKIPNRKVVELNIYKLKERNLLLNKIGTLNNVLDVATGYVRQP